VRTESHEPADLLGPANATALEVANGPDAISHDTEFVERHVVDGPTDQ
jgi:hypothetical protein